MTQRLLHTGDTRTLGRARTTRAGVAGRVTLLLVVALCITSSGCRRVEPAPAPAAPSVVKTYPIEINGHRLLVELAVTTEEHERGLQDRTELGAERGMLFIFRTPSADISFWMERTHIPLSLAFIDTGGMITQIEDMQPMSRDLHKSQFQTKFVLEVNRGWFSRHGVKVGDRADLSHIPAE